MIRRALLVGTAAAAAFLRPASAQQAVPGTLDQTSLNALSAMVFALQSSQLAQQRAELPTLRTFSGLETEEQMAFFEARRMAGLPVPATIPLAPRQAQMLQQLQALSGGEFDRMYLQGQMIGHQELLQLHSTLAQSSAMREERMLGMVAVPAIRSHLAMLQGVQLQMRG